MEWVASILHTTSEHGISSITTADAHTSAASSRLNWRPWRFKWTRQFRRKTKSGFCACAITFQTQFYSIRSNTNQYGWFWCLLYNTQCTCNLTMRCIRATIVAVSSATACSVRIVVNLLASVKQYKKVQCVHGNTTMHSLCTVDGLRNISYWLSNNMNVLNYSRKASPTFLSTDFRTTIRFPQKSFQRKWRRRMLADGQAWWSLYKQERFATDGNAPKVVAFFYHTEYSVLVLGMFSKQFMTTPGTKKGFLIPMSQHSHESYHYVNPLNPELNPICYLLALLAQHFLHVSRLRAKSLTIRLLMSYIYGAPILDVSRSYTTTHHSR